jgi:hypothetical protein
VFAEMSACTFWPAILWALVIGEAYLTLELVGERGCSEYVQDPTYFCLHFRRGRNTSIFFFEANTSILGLWCSGISLQFVLLHTGVCLWIRATEIMPIGLLKMQGLSWWSIDCLKMALDLIVKIVLRIPFTGLSTLQWLSSIDDVFSQCIG